MTVTSIGYGEMLPVSSAERAIACVLMLASGMIWTYVIGTTAGIMATLDPNGVLFHNTMVSTRLSTDGEEHMWGPA